MRKQNWLMTALVAITAIALGFAVVTALAPKISGGAAPTLAAKASSQVKWEPSFEAALAKAKSQNQLVMVDFFAEWCGACHLMDEETYPDTKVVAASRDFVNVKVDVDKRNDLAARYGVSSLPTIAWLKPDGKPVAAVVGAYRPKDFVGAMRAAQEKVKP